MEITGLTTTGLISPAETTVPPTTEPTEPTEPTSAGPVDTVEIAGRGKGPPSHAKAYGLRAKQLMIAYAQQQAGAETVSDESAPAVDAQAGPKVITGWGRSANEAMEQLAEQVVDEGKLSDLAEQMLTESAVDDPVAMEVMVHKLVGKVTEMLQNRVQAKLAQIVEQIGQDVETGMVLNMVEEVEESAEEIAQQQDVQVTGDPAEVVLGDGEPAPDTGGSEVIPPASVDIESAEAAPAESVELDVVA